MIFIILVALRLVIVIKFSHCNVDCSYENIPRVNPLYLIFHSATRYFKEEYDEKYLILDLIEKYEQVFFWNFIRN